MYRQQSDFLLGISQFDSDITAGISKSGDRGGQQAAGIYGNIVHDVFLWP